MGSFKNNIAHSQLKFGLRILKHVPVTNPCKPTLDLTQPDIHSSNPSITAFYENFTAWKIKEIGI